MEERGADRPVRVGFVGCGRQASASWYPNFATIPELELRACCDIVPELAERNARLFGAARWYAQLDKMLRVEEELDAVMVVGPPEGGEIDSVYADLATGEEAGSRWPV